MDHVEITERPGMRLAGVPHRGPYPEIGAAFGRLFAALTAARAWDRAGLMLGVYYYNPEPLPEAEFRSHAAVIWPEDMPLPEGLEEVRIAPGRVACLTLKGSYEGLAAAWDRLTGDWARQSGAVPTGPLVYELYRNDLSDTPPEDLLTELCLTVE